MHYEGQSVGRRSAVYITRLHNLTKQVDIIIIIVIIIMYCALSQ